MITCFAPLTIHSCPADPTDSRSYLTVADKRAQQVILDAVLAEWPELCIVAEEDEQDEVEEVLEAAEEAKKKAEQDALMAKMYGKKELDYNLVVILCCYIQRCSTVGHGYIDVHAGVGKQELHHCLLATLCSHKQRSSPNISPGLIDIHTGVSKQTSRFFQQ